jgi:hypothetical protein
MPKDFRRALVGVVYAQYLRNRACALPVLQRFCLHGLIVQTVQGLNGLGGIQVQTVIFYARLQFVSHGSGFAPTI